jgi:aldose 1-epimerase
MLASLVGLSALGAEQFGVHQGNPVYQYRLTNRTGMVCRIMDYGATVISLTAPDRKGKLEEVTLGFKNFDDYAAKSPYFGCAVGRIGNRIGKGKFKLDGKEYALALNDGPNTLHGGKVGFDKVIWKVEGVTRNSIVFSHVSPDGDEGYPGELRVTLKYTLTNQNALEIDYKITAKQKTIQNLTNHTYFNLGGGKDILDHRMRILSEAITPVDETLIPTGKLMAVKGTPFDLRRLTRIGNGIDSTNEQIVRGKGYDHNWVLAKKSGTLRKAAEVYEPKSGRFMEVHTTEPGIQFYSGNFLDGTLKGHGDKVYAKRSGFCLETQHFPDSINHSNFPSVILDAGKTYRTRTIYKFKAK